MTRLKNLTPSGTGAQPGAADVEAEAEVKRRAFEKRKEGESFEQSYARISNPYIDPVGGKLAKLLGSLPGPDHRAT